MAQLSQDCFAFGKKLIKLETALNKIKKNIKPSKIIEEITTIIIQWLGRPKKTLFMFEPLS